MMGRSYVTDHCIAAANFEQKQLAYRLYDSECLKMATESLSAVVAIISAGEIQPAYMAVSASEIFETQPKNEKAELTAEQVIADIMAELGEKEVETE